MSARPWLLSLYLIALSIGAFVLPAPIRLQTCALLCGYQVLVLWWIGKLSRRSFATIWRLKYLFLFLVLLYTFLPGGAGDREGSSASRQPIGLGLTLDWAGLTLSTTMCLQITLVALTAHLVRSAGSTDALVRGLRSMGAAPLLAYSLDATFGLLEAEPTPGSGRGMGRGHGRGMGGGGGGRGRRVHELQPAQPPTGDLGARGDSVAERQDGAGGPSTGSTADRTNGSADQGTDAVPPADSAPPSSGILAAIRQRELGPFVARVRQSLQTGQQRALSYGIDPDRAHDVGVITGIAAVMMSFKLLKVLPGIAFFSGHKTVFFIPLYLAAAELTRSRWGATTAGAIMGIIGFTFGDGRYGILEILKHIAPGLCVDLIWPLARRLPRSVWFFSVLGVLAAVARTSTEFVLTFALGARWEAYAFPALKLAPNLIAGVLSGIVAYPLITALADSEPTAPTERQEPQPHEQPART